MGCVPGSVVAEFGTAPSADGLRSWGLWLRQVRVQATNACSPHAIFNQHLFRPTFSELHVGVQHRRPTAPITRKRTRRLLPSHANAHADCSHHTQTNTVTLKT
eukprot:350950-Chlamydomonas_euryale.AAC.1